MTLLLMPPPTTNDARIAMEGIYNELRGQLAQAQASLAVKRWTLDDATAAGAKTSLDAAGALLAKLAPSGALTSRVLSGEKAPEWWRGYATEVREAIVYTMKVVGELLPSPSRLWEELVVPTAAELAQRTKDAASLGLDLAPWVLGAAIVLGLAYLVFSFKRGLA